MTSKLWTPTGSITPKVTPDIRKDAGGSFFDDELEDKEAQRLRFVAETQRLVDHINERPDHVVYVGSAEERMKMRNVFNRLFMEGTIGHHPSIDIDYGVPDGGIRIGDGR